MSQLRYISLNTAVLARDFQHAVATKILNLNGVVAELDPTIHGAAAPKVACSQMNRRALSESR
jgi:hypothetical protein